MLLTMFDHIYTVGDLEFAERELSNFSKIIRFDYKSKRAECNGDADLLRRRLSHYEFVDGQPTHIKMMMDAWEDVDFGDKWQWIKVVNKYATHGFYPFKGKFYPSMVRALLNIIGLKEGQTVLDPYCGCGTLNVEANMIGIDSIGVDVVPLFAFVSKTKCDALQGKGNLEKLAHLYALKECEKRGIPYAIALKNIKNGFYRSVEVLERLKSELNLNFGKSKIYARDNRNMRFLRKNSIDAVICSPPYSIALDYLKNHEVAIKDNGDNAERLKEKMCGLRGSNSERIENYYADLHKTIAEMHRVLKPDKFCVIIVGRTSFKGEGLRHDEAVLRIAKEIGFQHVLTIRNPLIGKNTMSVRHEYILFFKKGETSVR
jgi:DNA modification methylase